MANLQILLPKILIFSDKIISIGDAPSDFEMSNKANLKCSILVETGQVPIYQSSELK